VPGRGRYGSGVVLDKRNIVQLWQKETNNTSHSLQELIEEMKT